MLIRVYEQADGSVRVRYANEKHRNEGESDADFVARDAAHAEIADPTLADFVRVVDVERASLPPREKNSKAAREAWRIAGGTIVIDPAVLDALPVLEGRGR